MPSAVPSTHHPQDDVEEQNSRDAPKGLPLRTVFRELKQSSTVKFRDFPTMFRLLGKTVILGGSLLERGPQVRLEAPLPQTVQDTEACRGAWRGTLSL